MNCRAQYFHPCAFCHAVEFSPKLVVAIANDDLRSFTERPNVPQLLGRPLCSGRASDTNVHNTL